MRKAFVCFLFTLFSGTETWSAPLSATEPPAQNPPAVPAPAEDHPSKPTAKGKVIHAFVALCDNESQGIAKVPVKIGNGDDPANNLYWGCDDGLRSVFSKSKDWKRLDIRDPDGEGPILERLVFQHRSGNAWLVADAYRGREIRRCLTDYFAALSGNLAVSAETAELIVEAGGAAQLIAYLGHDGLMEFQVPVPGPSAAVRQAPKTAIALCCVSRPWFAPGLEKTGARPLLMTTQLMYPAAQLLRESAAGWLEGADGAACLRRAAAAYAANQKISFKAAAGVFWTGM